MKAYCGMKRASNLKHEPCGFALRDRLGNSHDGLVLVLGQPVRLGRCFQAGNPKPCFLKLHAVGIAGARS